MAAVISPIPCPTCGGQRVIGANGVTVCRPCTNESTRTRRKLETSVRDSMQMYAIEDKKYCKDYVMSHYSGGLVRCCCCKINDIDFLTIDHLDGGGRKHRRIEFGAAGGGGDKMYLWLRKNGMPSGYRVLCFNCNTAYGLYGCCPHVCRHLTRVQNDCRLIPPADARKRRAREVALLWYSGGLMRCACCAESSVPFLCLDHVNGGGQIHRRKVLRVESGSDFYAWLKRNRFPSGYQVLCQNCNNAKRAGKVCPHQLRRQAGGVTDGKT